MQQSSLLRFAVPTSDVAHDVAMETERAEAARTIGLPYPRRQTVKRPVGRRPRQVQWEDLLYSLLAQSRLDEVRALGSIVVPAAWRPGIMRSQNTLLAWSTLRPWRRPNMLNLGVYLRDVKG